jgi:nickel/cobalt exporter
MEEGLWWLVGTAVGLGFLHTLIGVDHSLPFVVLGRAQRWSLRKVLAITTACGIGHILSSVALGAVGIGFGVAVEKLNWIETSRGEVAAWLLIGFGLAYASWALCGSLRHRPHRHLHFHNEDRGHVHDHSHEAEHLHPHGLDRRALTVWGLFIVFVFGPCEPLIPLLMVPALKHSWAGVALVAAVFGVTTIGTMLALVTAGYYGLRPSYSSFLERHVHVIAGLLIAASGLAIKAFGI